MKTENVKAFCTGLLLCMATLGMTGCGNSSSGSASTTNGRLTSISDSQVVIEAFADDMKKMENVSGGMGLSNIRDRVKALGGTVQITQEKGFRIFVTIPKSVSN